MAHFLHIFIKPKEDLTRSDVEAVLNRAKDWFRYGPGIYIVYTKLDVAKWKERLIDLVKPGGSLFVAKLEIQERKGFMTDRFWRWIQSKPEGSQRGRTVSEP